jgi:XTP/dITP diphosphohydrolase
MKIYFVTSNSKKFEQVKEVLPSIERIDLDLEEIQTNDLSEISKYKAIKAFEKIKKPVIVDDTGVLFYEYNNFPGALAKFVATSLGLKGLKRLLENADNKKGCFITVLTYYDGKNLIQKEAKLECDFNYFNIDEKEFLNDKLPYNLIATINNVPLNELKKQGKLRTNQRKEAALKLKEELEKLGLLK